MEQTHKVSMTVSAWKKCVFGISTLFMACSPSVLVVVVLGQATDPSERYQGLITIGGKIYMPEMRKNLQNAIEHAPWIAGVNQFVTWGTLEPEKGKFNWKDVDSLIELLKKHDKVISFSILRGLTDPIPE